MGRLIDDLLSFSGAWVVPLSSVQRVRLTELVADAQREVAGAATAPVAWTIHPLPDVIADPSMLRHALCEPLSNAVKYSAVSASIRQSETA